MDSVCSQALARAVMAPMAKAPWPLPPLWGPRSFNIASGLARLSKAAGFIKATMPYTRPGTLNDADAYDVAAFVNSHTRPDYAGKALDWPKGGKPADSTY